MKKVLSFLFLGVAAAMCCPQDPLMGILVAELVIVLGYYVLPALGLNVHGKRTWYDNLAGSVNVTLAQGQLGSVIATNDGIMAMVLTGGIDTGGYVLGTPILITDYTGLAAAGITADGNAFALKEVREYYDQAGSGAQLYLMLVPNTLTLENMCDSANPDGAQKLLDYAHGKARVLGVMTNDALVPYTVDEGINADVNAAVVKMQAMLKGQTNLQQPMRGVIGSSYEGPVGDLNDWTTDNKNRVSLLVGNTTTGLGACLGLLLGTIASLPVQRKVSRVRNGSLPITAAFLGADAVEDLSPGTLDAVADNGVITFKTYPNLAGYYFSGDPTMTATNDDYAMLARGRVIDKAHILAYLTFVQEVDDDVPSIEGGKIEPKFAKWLESQITNQIDLAMTANGEISAVSCAIDLTQNVVSTSELNVVVTIRPKAYLTDINIKLGFSL